MKKSEIKKMTKQQALKDIDKLKKDLFNFRFQVANGQLKSSSKIKYIFFISNQYCVRMSIKWAIFDKIKKIRFKLLNVYIRKFFNMSP